MALPGSGSSADERSADLTSSGSSANERSAALTESSGSTPEQRSTALTELWLERRGAPHPHDQALVRAPKSALPL